MKNRRSPVENWERTKAREKCAPFVPDVRITEKDTHFPVMFDIEFGVQFHFSVLSEEKLQ